jgi:hypothetical protein
MRDVGLDGFARDRPLDEDNAPIDTRQSRPTMGELANGQLH